MNFACIVVEGLVMILVPMGSIVVLISHCGRTQVSILYYLVLVIFELGTRVVFLFLRTMLCSLFCFFIVTIILL